MKESARKTKAIKAMKKVLEEYAWVIDDNAHYKCTNCGADTSGMFSIPKFCTECGSKVKKVPQTSRCNQELWEAFQAGLDIWLAK